jgi:hypothetical protein
LLAPAASEGPQPRHPRGCRPDVGMRPDIIDHFGNTTLVRGLPGVLGLLSAAEIFC